MDKIRKSLFFVSIILAFNTLNTSAQLKISAEFRPRTELRHGYKALVLGSDESAFSISQRTRLNFISTTDKLSYRMSIQDVRVWGDQTQMSTTSNQLMLQQAWAEYKFNSTLSMKLGRQELDYDDARILGNVDWAQQARSHDIALFKYEDAFKLHLGAAYNQDAEKLKGTDYSVTGNYKTLQFLWFNKKISELGVSILLLNNGLQNKSADLVPVYKLAYTQTMGSRLSYNLGSTSLFAAGYYTTGKDITLRKVSAHYAAVGANVNINENWATNLGYELLSGTSQLEKKNNSNYTNASFNPFYGTNHKFNGLMDYFYVGNHLNGVGLNDIYGTIAYKNGKFNAGLTPHYFIAANEMIDPAVVGGKMNSKLGTEIDFTLGYKLDENVQISGGYSQMLATATLQQLNGSGDAKANNQWAWLMIAFKPDFLK